MLAIGAFSLLGDNHSKSASSNCYGKKKSGKGISKGKETAWSSK